MSTSTSALGRTAHSRKSSRKVIPNHVLGSTAVAGLVLGCAWTVYANIFAASVYPQLSSANYDSPVIRRQSTVVVRSAPPVVNHVVAALSEPAPLISAPATVPPGPSLSFQDRFAAAAPQGVEPKPQAEAPKLAEAPKPPAETPKLAEAAKPQIVASLPPERQAAPAPSASPRSIEARPAKGAGASVRDMAQRAKAAVMSIASNEKQSIVEKLWGKPRPRGPSLLAFASADASVTGSLGPSQNPALGGSQPRYDQSTAVYDISAHMVYLPDGTRLEAHSGLGSKLDDPSSANIRMRGVTPPHLYELTPREALFHGVAALRLNPVGGEDAIFGRTGLLAHTYMLGPNGDSNGCVSFRDYNAFLNAYRNRGIKRLAVVARVE
ncbi:MAG TPA: tlde1 domain-containing protein [Bradyrhizobium sp.]